MLARESVIDQLTVDEHGNVAVRRADRIIEDGEVLSTTYHRRVIGPDDDIAAESPRVRAIVTAARAHARAER